MTWGVSPNIIIFETETGNIVNSSIPSMKHPIFDLDSKNVYGNYNNSISKYSLETKSFNSSLEKESTDEYGFNDLSKDGKYFVATTKNGFKIWETNTGQLYKNYIYKNEVGMDSILFNRINFNCDANKLIVTVTKYYTDPIEDIPIIRESFIKYNVSTLDSIRDLGKADDWVLSPNCSYIAYKKWGKNNGVRIYELNTMNS